jgi:hypothetical protein
MCIGMPPIDWMLLLQVAHIHNPRLHLKSIAIEKIGVGPWSSHKKCKFLDHPCQMKFDYINVISYHNNTTYNCPCSHQQWDSSFRIQWVLNFVSRSLYDLIIQCSIVKKWSNISPYKYLPNYGGRAIHYYVQNILSMSHNHQWQIVCLYHN